MSDPYHSQYTNGDFMDTWRDNSTDTLNFESHGSTGRSFPATFSEQVFAEAQSEIHLGALDFLTATDPFHPDAATTHDDCLDIDLSLDWRVPDTSNDQFSNTRIPDNGLFPLENTEQQFPPFGQQLPVYNLQHSNFLDQDPQDFPLSAYPPLKFDDDTHSLPYGHQVIQQSGQLLPSNTQNLYSNNFGFTPNAQVAFNYDHRESSASPKEKSRFSLDNRKVSLNRAAKQRGDPNCDPSLCYSANPGKIAPWGSLTWNGQHLFSYTPKGQWLRDRCFNKQQFREYADNCGKETVFWVQQAPTQCNHRLDPEDRICRWANCPVANRTITAGWLRVAFDEFPHLTSNGSRDPLKCAGSVHLWCFEQIFDPTEFHLSGRLRAEHRQFPFEDKNVVTLEKLTDAGIIREAYRPWFAQRLHRFNLPNSTQPPREYRDSLSYRLNKYHLDNQTAARQKARSKRNNSKSQDERRTIDVHLGNLKLFVEISNKARRSKKSRRLQRTKSEDFDVNSSDSSQRVRLMRNGKQRIRSNWYPEPTQGDSFLHELQSRQSSLAGRNLQEASSRGMGLGYERHIQSNLAQLPSSSNRNRDWNTSQSNPTLILNMSSRQPSYFDPLNPAHNSMLSSIRPSTTATSVSPNSLQDSHLGISNHYSQNATGARFNRATRGQLRHSLRPIITQPLQQYPFSSMAVPWKLEDQQQMGSVSDNPNSQSASPGNELIKRDPDDYALTQPAGETLQLLGGSSDTSFFDSYRQSSPIHGNPDFDLIDPRLFGDELEVSQHQQEAVGEANDAFSTHTLMDPAVYQPLGTVDCTVSPRIAAASQSWDSLDSLMDTVDFGGFGGAGISPLLDDFTATNGADGERVATLTGVSISSPKVARLKRKNLSPSEATRSGQDSKRRRTDTSEL